MCDHLRSDARRTRRGTGGVGGGLITLDCVLRKGTHSDWSGKQARICVWGKTAGGGGAVAEREPPSSCRRRRHSRRAVGFVVSSLVFLRRVGLERAKNAKRGGKATSGLLPPALNQGEGAARLRAAPARARRGRLSIKAPMCRQTALHLGCRFHMHDTQSYRPLSEVFCHLALCRNFSNSR